MSRISVNIPSTDLWSSSVRPSVATVAFGAGDLAKLQKPFSQSDLAFT
jgi:hypothetical protein